MPPAAFTCCGGPDIDASAGPRRTSTATARHQSRLYAYQRGQVSGSFLLTSIAAVAARKAVRRGQTAAINRILDEVLLNPEAAALFLKENNPASRAALQRKAKLWMGNQAATVVDLLDGEDDPVKDAITRPVP